MRDLRAIPLSDLSVHTDPSQLSEEPEPISDRVALLPAHVQRALGLGLTAIEPHFHVFVTAAPELLLDEDIVAVAERAAQERAVPGDLVYVCNLDHPSSGSDAPRAMELPSGRGRELAEALEGLAHQLSKRIQELSSNDAVHSAERSLGKELAQKSREALSDLETRAKAMGFGVRSVQGGVQTFPILHGKPVSAEQFDVLDETTRNMLSDAEEALSAAVDAAAKHIRAMTEEAESARNDVMQRMVEGVLREEITQLQARFEDLPEVAAFLEQVATELEHAWSDVFPFLGAVSEAGEAQHHSQRERTPGAIPLFAERFGVHVLVSHAPDEPGAPVVYEMDPSAARLFGYIERRAVSGALVSAFPGFRTGSLVQASGGTLIVRVRDLLVHSEVWEQFKRALRNRACPFEDVPSAFHLLTTTIHPQPAPFNTRVILLGSDDLYTELMEVDPDFAALFRIKVEVDPYLPRTPETLRGLDGYLMTLAHKRGWLPFDREARARLLDVATRVVGDREHITIVLPPLEETASFASEKARYRSANEVTWADVDGAWDERHERSSALARHVRDQVLRGEILIETDGTRVGVVNGLAVVTMNDVHFGQPMRITAVVSLGHEGLIDVEREAHLGGSVHTKGVAILRGLLSLLFGQERPLSLRAQITFEQSYGEVDGDSASSSELFAILSALAEVGVDQGLAVTGSVNQLGEIQPIGGVCAKIEAFYDLCNARGLTGKQGVMIPQANVRHLVLRDDVAKAIEQQRFFVYGVRDVWEGIEVLSGVPAGKRDESGRFPAASVFGRVERRIIEIAERLRRAESWHHDALSANNASEPEGAAISEFRWRRMLALGHPGLKPGAAKSRNDLTQSLPPEAGSQSSPSCQRSAGWKSSWCSRWRRT